MASVYRFPSYFHIDRDIVHGAAFDNARKLGQPLVLVGANSFLVQMVNGRPR